MKQLIRFEDKYGMSDIWYILTGNIDKMPNYTIRTSSINTIQINENLWIQSDLSLPRALTVTEELIPILDINNIDEITLVYDLDNLGRTNGKNVNGIIKHIIKLKERIQKELNISIEIKLAPIVWSAETFALYILAYDKFSNTYLNELDIERLDVAKIVHSISTPKFQGLMIQKLLEQEGNTALYKKLRDYIPNNSNTLKDRLRYILEIFPDSINKEVITYLLTNDTSNLFTLNTISNHYAKINNVYAQGIQNKTIKIYGKEYNIDEKYW